MFFSTSFDQRRDGFPFPGADHPRRFVRGAAVGDGATHFVDGHDESFLLVGRPFGVGRPLASIEAAVLELTTTIFDRLSAATQLLPDQLPIGTELIQQVLERFYFRLSVDALRKKGERSNEILRMNEFPPLSLSTLLLIQIISTEIIEGHHARFCLDKMCKNKNRQDENR